MPSLSLSLQVVKLLRYPAHIEGFLKEWQEHRQQQQQQRQQKQQGPQDSQEVSLLVAAQEYSRRMCAAHSPLPGSLASVHK